MAIDQVDDEQAIHPSDPHEAAARRKAVLWCSLAGVAQLGTFAIAPSAGSALANILIAVGYAFILPGVAVLQARTIPHRQSGAFLASMAGTATVTVGIGASVNADLHSAGLLLMGIWWWTLGKMGVETGVLPRTFGYATAGAGALSILGALALPSLFAGAHAVLGIWLVMLAALFAQAGAHANS